MGLNAGVSLTLDRDSMIEKLRANDESLGHRQN